MSTPQPHLLPGTPSIDDGTQGMSADAFKAFFRGHPAGVAVITAVGDDGTITIARDYGTGTVVRDDGTSRARKRRSRFGGSIVLPASYVAEHVDLGYAVTAYRAQGITTDTAHVLVEPTSTRETFYVAMTRGRHSNHAYVTLDRADDHAQPYPGDARLHRRQPALDRRTLHDRGIALGMLRQAIEQRHRAADLFAGLFSCLRAGLFAGATAQGRQ